MVLFQLLGQSGESAENQFNQLLMMNALNMLDDKQFPMMWDYPMYAVITINE